jgi:superfamily II DNA or RNA helicase
MNILKTFKNIFKKPEEPQEPKRLPKALLSEYRQNFQAYEEFHKKHRDHQKGALFSLEGKSIGQVSLPTGTGKTRVQVDVHIADMIQKTKENKTGVYVIGAHRLALCSQLLHDMVEVAIPCGLNFDILYVGSERFNNDAIRLNLRNNGNVSENLRAFNDKISTGLSTTKQDEVLDFVTKSKQNNRHVIAVATYHSFHKLALLNKIDICTYDEAHITLGDDFSDNISRVKPMIEKNFFFTATRKIIGSTSGMNNTELYGNVLYEVSPRRMIEAGEIVPPRIHSIRISDDAEDGNYDNNKMLVKTIIEGFAQHKKKLKEFSSNPDQLGAKLLISCSGSEELKEIINSNTFKDWCEENNVKMFSFSSNTDIGYRFNFQNISRSELFAKMDILNDNDDAILIHIDILTEGIDLPSITGVMPLRNLNQSKLIQTIGRATRLLGTDRNKLYNGEIKPYESEKFVKPYCWFLLPQLFSSLGDYGQMKRLLREIMNTYEVKPEEFSSADRFIAEPDSVLPKVTIDDLINRREKECNLSHIFEEIFVSQWKDEMDNLDPKERYESIKKQLEEFDA